MSDKKKIDTFGEGISLASGDSHNTLQGAIPGSISTSGQFQVWAKMSVNQLKSKAIDVSNKMNGIESSLKEHDLHVQQSLRKDEEQEKLLVSLKVRVEEGEKKAEARDKEIEKQGFGGMSMGDTIKMAITIGTLVVSLVGVYFKLKSRVDAVESEVKVKIESKIDLLEKEVTLRLEQHKKDIESLTKKSEQRRMMIMRHMKNGSGPFSGSGRSRGRRGRR